MQVVLGELGGDLSRPSVLRANVPGTSPCSSRPKLGRLLTVSVQSRTAPSSCWIRSACCGSSIRRR